MSRLYELIKNLCPDGVEYKNLGDISTIERGKRFVHADAVDTGIPCIYQPSLQLGRSSMNIIVISC